MGSSAASQDAQEVLRQALAGRGDAVAGTIGALLGRDGLPGAYDVAWRLAASTLGDGVARGGWSLDFPDIEHAAYDARWVARFLSAFANSDADTAHALLHAAESDGHLDECLMTLAGSAAATIRHRSPPPG